MMMMMIDGDDWAMNGNPSRQTELCVLCSRDSFDPATKLITIKELSRYELSPAINEHNHHRLTPSKSYKSCFV
jgi:hypothetical protein